MSETAPAKARIETPKGTTRITLAWLTAQEPTAEVGLRRAACDCPVAQFLKAQGAAMPAVTHEYFRTGGAYEWHRRNLPAWAAEFVRRTDDDGVGMITAAEALAVLDTIL
jgi:hypothetical protein